MQSSSTGCTELLNIYCIYLQAHIIASMYFNVTLTSFQAFVNVHHFYQCLGLGLSNTYTIEIVIYRMMSIEV